jgi:hypothetical protein
VGRAKIPVFLMPGQECTDVPRAIHDCVPPCLCPCRRLRSPYNIVLSKAKITKVDEFCEKLLCSPTFLCNYIKPDACQVLMRDRLGRPLAADAGSQTIEDTIDVLTAEGIVTEAVQIGDEQAAKQAAAR